MTRQYYIEKKQANVLNEPLNGFDILTKGDVDSVEQNTVTFMDAPHISIY